MSQDLRGAGGKIQSVLSVRIGAVSSCFFSVAVRTDGGLD